MKGIDVDRFSYLHNALTPSANDLKEVFKLLSDSFQRVLNEVHILTLDETVIEFQPSTRVKEEREAAGTPITVVYIPRKPPSKWP